MRIFLKGAKSQSCQKLDFSYTSFPNIWEQTFTLLFALMFTYLTAQSLLTYSLVNDNALLVWTSALSMLVMYLPSILRQVSLAPSEHPAARLYFILPLIVIFTSWSIAIISEQCGLNTWLVDVTGTPEMQEVVDAMSSSQDGSTRFALIVTALIVAPIGEECFFRGFLYTTLRQQARPIAAAIIAGAYFGAVHISLLQMLPLTVFGIMQCLIYERCRTLWIPILTHFTFNALNCLFVLLSVS